MAYSTVHIAVISCTRTASQMMQTGTPYSVSSEDVGLRAVRGGKNILRWSCQITSLQSQRSEYWPGTALDKEDGMSGLPVCKANLITMWLLSFEVSLYLLFRIDCDIAANIWALKEESSPLSTCTRPMDKKVPDFFKLIFDQQKIKPDKTKSQVISNS